MERQIMRSDHSSRRYTFGETVKRLRLEKNLSLQCVAEVLGVSIELLVRIEDGIELDALNDDLIIRFASVLDSYPPVEDIEKEEIAASVKYLFEQLKTIRCNRHSGFIAFAKGTPGLKNFLQHIISNYMSIEDLIRYGVVSDL